MTQGGRFAGRMGNDSTRRKKLPASRCDVKQMRSSRELTGGRFLGGTGDHSTSGAKFKEIRSARARATQISG
jgi:hypothetical protein